jgi:hypothetical protein
MLFIYKKYPLFFIYFFFVVLDLIENCQFKPNLLKSFQGHNGTVWSVAITKDTKYIISASGGAVYGDNNWFFYLYKS